MKWHHCVYIFSLLILSLLLPTWNSLSCLEIVYPVLQLKRWWIISASLHNSLWLNSKSGSPGWKSQHTSSPIFPLAVLGNSSWMFYSHLKCVMPKFHRAIKFPSLFSSMSSAFSFSITQSPSLFKFLSLFYLQLTFNQSPNPMMLPLKITLISPFGLFPLLPSDS